MSINHNLFSNKQEEQFEIRTDSKEIDKELEESRSDEVLAKPPLLKDKSRKKDKDAKGEKEKSKLRLDLLVQDSWQFSNQFVVKVPSQTALKTDEYSRRFSNQFRSSRRKKKQKNVKSRLYQKLVNYNALTEKVNAATDTLNKNACAVFKNINENLADNEDFADLAQFFSAGSGYQFLNQDLAKIFLYQRDEMGNINEDSARMAIVKMAQQLLDFDISVLHFESDTEMIRDADKLELLSAQLGAFDSLSVKYNFFEQIDKNKKAQMLERLDTLRTISAYYLVRKQLITNPLYKERYNYELSMDKGAAVPEAEKQVADLLMKSHVLGKKLLLENTKNARDRVNLRNTIKEPNIRSGEGRLAYTEIQGQFDRDHASASCQDIINDAYQQTRGKTQHVLDNMHANKGINESLILPGQQILSGDIQEEQEKTDAIGGIVLKTILSSDEFTALKGTKDMAAMCRNIQAFQNILGNEMPPIKYRDDGLLDDENEKKAREAIDATCMMVTMLYQRISDATKKLVTKYGKAYPEVCEMLTEFAAQNEKERESFKEKALEYRAHMISDPAFADEQGKTWLSAFRYNKGVFYDLDNDKELEVKTDGAAASLLHVITRKVPKTSEHPDGKETVYFRKKDIVPSDDNSELVDMVLKDIQLPDKVFEETKILFNKLLEPGRVNFLNGVIIFVNDCKKRKMTPMQMAKSFFLKYKMKSSADFTDQDYEQYGDALFEYVGAVAKRNMSNRGIECPHIKGKRNLSDRNVATSRLANLLGMGSLVCDSRTTTIKMNGKLVEGNLMEGSGGIATNGKKAIPYTMDAVSQIFMVHIFDYICGQVDRHFSNFHGIVRDGKIVGIKCLDNDMSFGLLKAADLRDNIMNRKRYNQLRPLTQDLILGMPAAFANKIMGLNRDILQQILGDILNDEEMDALIDRIDMIKSEITDIPKIYPNAKAEWDKDRNRLIYKGEDADDQIRQLKAIERLREAKYERGFEHRCLLYSGNIDAMGKMDELLLNRRTELGFTQNGQKKKQGKKSKQGGLKA